MRRLLPIALAAILFSPTGIAAQAPDPGDCPPGHWCGEYVYEGEAYPVEIARRHPAACIVIEAEESTVRTIAGEREGEESAWCVLYVARGNGYEIGVERIDLDQARAALADPGEDSLVLHFSEPQ